MYVIIMNSELLLDMIYVSTIASIISSQAIQKIKGTLNFGKIGNSIISIFLSISIGICYALCFYTSNLLYAIWIGLFTLIGAEGLYKTFNGFFGLESKSKRNGAEVEKNK